MRRSPPKWLLLSLALVLSAAAVSCAHWSRPSSQRVFLASQPGLFRDDMDGDGIDDFIIAQVDPSCPTPTSITLVDSSLLTPSLLPLRSSFVRFSCA
jgi:hypothetical protein